MCYNIIMTHERFSLANEHGDDLTPADQEEYQKWLRAAHQSWIDQLEQEHNAQPKVVEQTDLE